MISRHCTIINKLGLHARAAAKFASLAAGFDSHIELVARGRAVNAKSIMGLMTLAASKGTEVEIRARGKDAEQAIAQLGQLIADKFGEEH